MNFEAFDTRKIDEYAKQAKESWGKTAEWKEYQKKSAGRTAEDESKIAVKLMSVFGEIGEIRDTSPESPEAQRLVRKLQDSITENYYTCSDEILSSLGKMYAGGGSFTQNIDKVGGAGTAEFTHQAIEAYVNGKKKD